jgi:hypothetical protein
MDQKKSLVMLDCDRSQRIVAYLSGDSKSTVGNHMGVQVPPSAPKFLPTIFRFLAGVVFVL